MIVFYLLNLVMNIEKIIKGVASIGMTIFLVSLTTYALTYPSNSPTWETPGGLFKDNFDKIFWALSFSWWNVWIGIPNPTEKLVINGWNLKVNWNWFLSGSLTVDGDIHTSTVYANNIKDPAGNIIAWTPTDVYINPTTYTYDWTQANIVIWRYNNEAKRATIWSELCSAFYNKTYWYISWMRSIHPWYHHYFDSSTNTWPTEYCTGDCVAWSSGKKYVLIRDSVRPTTTTNNIWSYLIYNAWCKAWASKWYFWDCPKVDFETNICNWTFWTNIPETLDNVECTAWIAWQIVDPYLDYGIINYTYLRGVQEVTELKCW